MSYKTIELLEGNKGIRVGGITICFAPSFTPDENTLDRVPDDADYLPPCFDDEEEEVSPPIAASSSSAVEDDAFFPFPTEVEDDNLPPAYSGAYAARSQKKACYPPQSYSLRSKENVFYVDSKFPRPRGVTYVSPNYTGVHYVAEEFPLDDNEIVYSI